MEKTRDFFKKIRDTKGTFHAKMGTIKDRNKERVEKTHMPMFHWVVWGGQPTFPVF